MKIQSKLNSKNAVKVRLIFFLSFTEQIIDDKLMTLYWFSTHFSVWYWNSHADFQSQPFPFGKQMQHNHPTSILPSCLLSTFNSTFNIEVGEEKKMYDSN